MRTDLVELLRMCGEQTSRKYRTFRVPMPVLVPGVIELAEWESFHGAIIEVTREEYASITGAKYFAFETKNQCPECTTFGKYHRKTCSLRFSWNIDPEVNRPTIAKVMASIASRQFIEASNTLGLYLYKLLASGDYGTVGVLLEALEPKLLPPLVLSDALRATYEAREALGTPRERFLEGARAAIPSFPDTSEGAIISILRSLR